MDWDQNCYPMVSLQKAKTYMLEALFENYKLFHNRLNILENTEAVLAKVTFSDLHALKTRINGPDQ